jgi:predicted TIM-barrel fold metal-dependent hydrolase
MPASVTAETLPNIVSIDDHVVEPASIWTDRLSSRWQGAGPRVVRERVDKNLDPAGDAGEWEWCDVWYYEGIRFPIQRVIGSVGFDPEDVEKKPVTFDEMRPGCYQAEERLLDMTIDGVDVSVCFPNLWVRFCGQRFLEGEDKELAQLCVRAYNDWMAEEWAGRSGGRLVPVSIIPLWDPVAAAVEVQRNADRGFRVVCFSELPSWMGLPSIFSGEWDAFLAVCNDTDTVVAMHIGSASGFIRSSPDAPDSVHVANLYINSSLSLSDWLVSGLLDRFPRLKLAYAEAQAGWMPYIVQRLDGLWEQGNAYNRLRQTLAHPPGRYFEDHIFTCVFSDPVGLGPLLEVVGEHNVSFETDYPHPDGTWPNSKARAAEQLAGVDLSVASKIVRGNAERLLGLRLSG